MHIVDNFKDYLNRKSASKYQKIANDYWKSCSNSHIGYEELYVNQENGLLELFVPKVFQDDRILDIGCSNGRFTFLVSKYCKEIKAFDLSPSLINLAQEQAKEGNISNINFSVADIRDLNVHSIYDHVMCMGVFTTIPDERLVKNTILKFPQIIKKNGYLVLKDTLASLNSELYTDGHYAASYRNEKSYISMFEKVGMKLEEEKVLSSSNMINQQMSSKLLLFKNVQ